MPRRRISVKNWMSVRLHDSYVEALTPQCEGLRDKALGRELELRLGHVGGVLMRELVAS